MPAWNEVVRLHREIDGFTKRQVLHHLRVEYMLENLALENRTQDYSSPSFTLKPTIAHSVLYATRNFRQNVL